MSKSMAELETILKKFGISNREYVMLIMFDAEADSIMIKKDYAPFLIEKGIVNFVEPNILLPTKECGKLLDSIKEEISSLERKKLKLDYAELTSLAEALKEIYPKGKKPGTNYYWAEGPALIVKRLQQFFAKYGHFPKDSVIEATKLYLKGYERDNTYMQLLKYFIFKDKIVAGEVQYQSELYNYLGALKDKEYVPEDENWTDNLI